MFLPLLGEDDPILTSIFVRWVESNHQQVYIGQGYHATFPPVTPKRHRDVMKGFYHEDASAPFSSRRQSTAVDRLTSVVTPKQKTWAPAETDEILDVLGDIVCLVFCVF